MQSKKRGTREAFPCEGTPRTSSFCTRTHSNCECTCFLFWPVFSGLQMGPGRRSRTTSESSTHSGGRERSNSAVKQASPPPPSIPEQPRKEEAKKVKKDSPKKVHTHTLAWRCSVGAPAVFTSGQRNIPSFTQGGGGGGGGWLKSWLWKGKNEAHLPDDKNKSVSSCWLYSYGFCLCTYVLKMVNIDKSAMFFIARLCGMSRSRNGSTWTSLKRRSVAWNVLFRLFLFKWSSWKIYRWTSSDVKLLFMICQSKPPPPPPSCFPAMPHMPGPGGHAGPPSGGPPGVNVYSRKAGEMTVWLLASQTKKVIKETRHITV